MKSKLEIENLLNARSSVMSQKIGYPFRNGQAMAAAKKALEWVLNSENSMLCAMDKK